MKQFIVINKRQYGYHTDTYKYTQYLRSYDITYICFDTGKKKYKSGDEEVIYVQWGTSRILNAFRFFRKIFKELKEAQPNGIVFIKNFELCFLITFFNSKLHYLLDLRTLAVTGSKIRRAYIDSLTKLNTFFFKKISVISEGLAKRLGLSDYHILPLGADVISDKNKSFDIPRLFYIGTLNNRNLSEVVKGYCEFLAHHEEYAERSEFHIVGDGHQKEIDTLTESISKYDKFLSITYHGYKNHNEVAHLFDRCNVGISFVPQVAYYDHQPPTKVFEYLLSGLICVGTNTAAHLRILNETNGIVSEDNSKGIFTSLETFTQRKETYNSEEIKNTVKDNTWEHIVAKHLQYILEDLQ